MSNEIAIYQKLNDPILAIEKLGTAIARSGLSGGDRVEIGNVLAWACLTENKSPIQVIREYHIIEGRLTDRADALLAKFVERGGKFKVLTRTTEAASVQLTTKGGESMTFSLTWEEAQKEPFVSGKDGLKKNWRTPRARMQTMWARVISDGVRTLDPGIAAGIKATEELDDELDTQAGPALDLQAGPQTQAEAVRAKKLKSNIIEVSATTTVEAPAPASAPAETETATAPAAEKTPEEKEVERLLGVLEVKLSKHRRGDFTAKALEYIRRTGMVSPKQGFEHLKLKQLLRLIENTRGNDDPPAHSDSFTVAVLGKEQ